MNQSRSMMSLSKINETTTSQHNGTLQKNKGNRFSVLVNSNNLKCFDDNSLVNKKISKSKMKTSVTTGNLRLLSGQPTVPITQQTTITKNCISNPCAFLHVNTLKDCEHRVKLIVQNCENIDKKFQ